MKQLSLFENAMPLAGVMPCIRAEMRRIAGDDEGEGRKKLADTINAIASRSEIRLTSGNKKTVSKETLDKWLSPSDTSHPPSVLAILVFCLATNENSPLQILTKATGCDLMSAEDRRYRDYGKAAIEEKTARERKKQLERSL